MMKPLEEVLQFKNKAVLHRFRGMHGLAEDESRLIFEDTLRYLWLTATMDLRRKTDSAAPDIVLWENMGIIDEMWHCFILHTVRYVQFCDDYFGYYLHHPPALYKYESNIEKHGEEQAKEVLVTELIETVYDQLGKDVAMRWFDTYQQYNHLHKVH